MSKKKKEETNTCHNVPELKVMSSPTVQKPNDSSFNVINDKAKQQILAFKKLNPANVRPFCLKND